MKIAIQHLYRPSHEGDGLLYAWFSSMHTRVDILLYSQKPEEELMSVVERIHAALSYLEKIANYYDPASELAVINRTASMSQFIQRIIIRTPFIRCICQRKNAVSFSSNRELPSTFRDS